MDAIINIILWIVYFLALFFAIFWLSTFFIEEEDKEKKLKSYPKVSVTIPAYNEEKTIRKTVESVLDLDYPQEKVEVLVVDDGSTDRTAAIVEQISKENPIRDIKLIQQKNQGKGAALNNALNKCKGNFFVCLDADSYVQKNALKILLPYFEDEDVGAALPALKVRAEKGNLLEKMQRYEYIVNMFYKELMAKLDCIRVTPGPFSVYRKKVLEEVGGFDEKNLTEDLEMALRLQYYDYKIIQRLDTYVVTEPPKSFKELYKQRNRWYKGSISNTLKYKKMLLKKKYGDFAFVQMPATLISGAMMLFILFSMIYYTLKPVYINIKHFSLVDFDFLIFIKDWIFGLTLWDLNFSLIFIGLSMAGISLYILKKSHYLNKEKVFKYGLVPFGFYVLFYFILLALMWVGISFDLLTGKRQKW